jgi:hypothetical protein
VTAPILTLPETFLLRTASFGRGQRTTMYVLINDRIEREFEVVPNGTLEIAARASASIVKTQLRSVLYETFTFSRRSNIGFKLTYIGREVSPSGSLEFRTSFMRTLYQYGYDKAKGSAFWESALLLSGQVKVPLVQAAPIVPPVLLAIYCAWADASVNSRTTAAASRCLVTPIQNLRAISNTVLS